MKKALSPRTPNSIYSRYRWIRFNRKHIEAQYLTKGQRITDVYGDVSFVIEQVENVVLTTKGHIHITKIVKIAW